jgi:hypothetical protein
VREIGVHHDENVAACRSKPFKHCVPESPRRLSCDEVNPRLIGSLDSAVDTVVGWVVHQPQIEAVPGGLHRISDAAHEFWDIHRLSKGRDDDGNARRQVARDRIDEGTGDRLGV